MSDRQSRIVVLAGPSAVGKSTIVQRLRAEIPDLYFSVSMTTRQPRAGEENGKDYFFVTREEFDAKIADGSMLEWADIHGGIQRSGTPREPILRAQEEGRPVLIEVDLVGTRSVKALMPEVVTVFIAPPSAEILEQRLIGRGTESEEIVARRLETARTEMAAQDEFDRIIVNSDLNKAVQELVDIFRS